MKRTFRLRKAILFGGLSLFFPTANLMAQNFDVPSGTTLPPLIVNGGTTGTVQKGGKIESIAPGTVPLEIQSPNFTTKVDGTISSTGAATGGILYSVAGGNSFLNIGASGLIDTTDFGISSTNGTNLTITVAGKINSAGRSIFLSGGNNKIDVTGGFLSNDIDLIGNSNDTVTISNGSTLKGNVFLNGGNDTVNISNSSVEKQISFVNGGASTLNMTNTTFGSASSIFATGGSQTITLNHVTGGKEIILQNGDHTVIIKNGSNFTDKLMGTGGKQAFSIYDSVFGGQVFAQGSENSITLQNSKASQVFAQGAGPNAISLTSSTVAGQVFVQNGTGKQTITVNGGSVGGQVFAQGTGTNSISITNATINGQVFAQNGTTQTITIEGGTLNGQVFGQGIGPITIRIENVGGSSNQVFAQTFVGTNNHSVTVRNFSVTDQIFAQGTGNHTVLVENAGTLRQVFGQGNGSHTVTVRNTNVFDQVFAESNGAGSNVVTVENTGSMRQVFAHGTGSQTVNVTNATLSGIIEASSNGVGGNMINGTNVTADQVISNGGAAASTINLKNSTINNQVVLNGGGGGTITLDNTKTKQIDGSNGDDAITLKNGSSTTGGIFANQGNDTINILNNSKVGGDISNQGTLKVNVQNGSTVSGNIFGQTGADDVVLQNGSTVGKNIFLNNGDNKVTVDGSTVKGEIGVGTGNDTVSLKNGGVVEKNIDFGAAGNDVLNIINGGTVNGSSRGDDLNITGGGVANLKNFVVMSNKTTISGATANVVDTLTSSNGVDVNAGGILTGNGVVNAPLTQVNAGGAVAPSGLGNLTLQGNFQSASGNLHTNLNGPSSNLLAITGSAAVSGGTVIVYAMPGSPYLPGTTWKVLSASGGLSGMYGSVTDNLAFVKFSQSATANDLFLTSATDFAGPASTPNQIAMGNYLNAAYPLSSGEVRTVLNTLLGLDGRTGLKAMDSMSGEIYGSSSTVVIEQSSAFLRNITNHLRLADAGGSTISVPSGQQTARANSMSGSGIQPVSYAVPDDPAVIWRDLYVPGPTSRAWLFGFGTGGDFNGDGNAQGFNYALTGATFGVDQWIEPTLLIGVSSGYGYAFINGDNNSGTNNINSFQLAFYGRKDIGAAYLSGALGYAHDEYNSRRTIVVGPISQRVNGLHGGDQFTSYLETGVRCDFNTMRLIPSAAVQYLGVTQNGFTETGGPLALNVGRQNADSLRSIFGLQALGNPVASQFGSISPMVYARWTHEYFNQDRIVNAGFAGVGVPGFSIRGANLGTEYINTGIGVLSQHNSWLRSSVYYDFQAANQNAAHTLAGQLEVLW
jgi:fibronectin-binding autotransporter adhesin